MMDALRAIAALGVLMHHAREFAPPAWRPLRALFWEMNVGVAIFFVISGFLLFRPFVAAATGAARRSGSGST